MKLSTKEKFNRRDTSLIPEGIYCYTSRSVDEKGRMKITICPYWDQDHTHFHYQEHGYCHLLEEGDWEEEGTLLLWDQCKECGINEGGIYEWLL